MCWFAHKTKLCVQNERHHVTTVKLTSFTSDRIKTYGEIDVLITVANTSVKHTMIVADMVDYHCLLGLDFLKYAFINIDVRRNEWTSKYGTTKFMKYIHQLPKAKTLKSSADITIPANTVMFIHGKLADMNCRDEKEPTEYCSTMELW